jgi:hypothetical protein
LIRKSLLSWESMSKTRMQVSRIQFLALQARMSLIIHLSLLHPTSVIFNQKQFGRLRNTKSVWTGN